MSVNLYQATRRHNSKDSIFYSDLHQNLRFSYSFYLFPNHVVYKLPAPTDNKPTIMYVMTL